MACFSYFGTDTPIDWLPQFGPKMDSNLDLISILNLNPLLRTVGKVWWTEIVYTLIKKKDDSDVRG